MVKLRMTPFSGIGAGAYLLFLRTCPYEWGIRFQDWKNSLCPFIIRGNLVNWITERPVQAVQVSIGDTIVYSDADGKFLIKIRKEKLTDIRQITFNKDKYLTEKIGFEVPDDSVEKETEIDLGSISVTPAGRVIFQAGGSIYSTDLDGTDERRLADGKLIAIGSKYDKFIFKTSDRALRIMDTDGKNEMKFGELSDKLCGLENLPNITAFSNDVNVFAWISCYLTPGTIHNTEINEEVQFYNFRLGRQGSIKFSLINDFRISPDGKYIAVRGYDFNHKTNLLLYDVEKHMWMDPGHAKSGVWSYFLDDKNLYYISGFGWSARNHDNGLTTSLSAEPEWWQNKQTGVLKPITKDKLAVLKPGHYIKITDQDGLNNKITINIETISKTDTSEPGDLMWSDNENYLTFKTTDSTGALSLWLIDAESGKYKKIIDL